MDPGAETTFPALGLAFLSQSKGRALLLIIPGSLKDVSHWPELGHMVSTSEPTAVSEEDGML